MAISPEMVDLDSARAQELVRQSIPFTSRVRWAAHDRWSSPAYLKSRMRPMQISGARYTNGQEELLELDIKDVIDIVSDPERGPNHVFQRKLQTRLWVDGAPHPALGDLLEDIVIPKVIPAGALQSINVWMHPGPYVLPTHTDSNGASNLSVQVTGRKRWRLFHPDLAGKLKLIPALEKLEPPLASIWTKSPDDPEVAAVLADTDYLEVTLEPGSVVFVPPFWIHAVEAPERELPLTVNFWWTHVDRVSLTPISAGWAYLQALIDVMKQRRPGASLDEVCADLRALGDDTKQLLRDIEHTLQSRPHLLDSEIAVRLRR